MKKTTFLLALILISISWVPIQAQEKNNDAERLNNYEYVIVPLEYKFQDKENEYLLNSRVKHLLDQEGFKTVVDDGELPTELRLNPCSALTADLKSLSESFFSMNTELKLVFKNCRNKVVFETEVGESRKKDFKEGYTEALKNAFSSFNGVHYKYNGNKGVEEGVASHKKENPSTKESQKGENPLLVTLDKKYTQGGNTYQIKKIEAGYLLVNSQTGDRQALLNVTEDKTILFNGTAVNGTASVKEGGKIIKVEYFDQKAGTVKQIKYEEKE